MLMFLSFIHIHGATCLCVTLYLYVASVILNKIVIILLELDSSVVAFQ
jgi:hypothetical protein